MSTKKQPKREARLPKEDDVLRRLMATPPDPRKQKKKAKKRAK